MSNGTINAIRTIPTNTINTNITPKSKIMAQAQNNSKGQGKGKGKRFNLSKRPVQTATAVLEESDFLSQKAIEDGSIEQPIVTEAREWIGLELTVRRNLSMETQFQLEKLAHLQNQADVAEVEKAYRGMAALLPSVIVEWSLDEDEGRPLPITAESILSFDNSLTVALQMTMQKASTQGQGRMSPNA